VLETITIHLSKAANGQDYVQIASPAAIPVNIVLVASHIEVIDKREPPKEPKVKKKGD
jgi:hypothetical protein